MAMDVLDARFTIESWEEQPYREFEDGSKLSRAEVALSGRDEGFGDATFAALLHYLPDGTSTYVTLMHITGTLHGRSGSFVLRGDGEYDGESARGRSVIVPGSGTGRLAGITGTAESVSTHKDYPHMPLTLTYDLP